MISNALINTYFWIKKIFKKRRYVNNKKDIFLFKKKPVVPYLGEGGVCLFSGSHISSKSGESLYNKQNGS